MTITGVLLKARYRQSTTTYKTSYCCFFLPVRRLRLLGFALQPLSRHCSLLHHQQLLMEKSYWIPYINTVVIILPHSNACLSVHKLYERYKHVYTQWCWLWYTLFSLPACKRCSDNEGTKRCPISRVKDPCRAEWWNSTTWLWEEGQWVLL